MRGSPFEPVKKIRKMKIELQDGQRLELAFGRVVNGREDQLFGEYFPMVGPILAEYGARPLGSFKVLESIGAEDAEFGALFIWPSTDTYHQFHADPRFRELKPLRDEALSLLSNGHFFAAADVARDVPDQDLTLKVGVAPLEEPEPLLVLGLADDSPQQKYAEKNLVLSQATEGEHDPTAETACRIRFNT